MDNKKVRRKRLQMRHCYLESCDMPFQPVSNRIVFCSKACSAKWRAWRRKQSDFVVGEKSELIPKIVSDKKLRQLAEVPLKTFKDKIDQFGKREIVMYKLLHNIPLDVPVHTVKTVLEPVYYFNHAVPVVPSPESMLADEVLTHKCPICSFAYNPNIPWARVSPELEVPYHRYPDNNYCPGVREKPVIRRI